MPWGLERWQGGHDLHFITFSCFHREPILSTPVLRDMFLVVLERVRQRYALVVLGYVVMPEHVHLLISEPQDHPLATAIQAMKLGFARRVLAERRRRVAGYGHSSPGSAEHIWQARYYDFNVTNPQKEREKLRYMHRNPVKRGLVESPEQWRWSSYCDYAFRETGVVKVNDWSVLKMKSIEPLYFPQ